MEGDPDLSPLPVVDGFRMRGEAVTLLETFVDAAFAFAITLLVVSFNAMPTSFPELYEALRPLPAFLAAFAILAMFWQSHKILPGFSCGVLGILLPWQANATGRRIRAAMAA